MVGDAWLRFCFAGCSGSRILVLWYLGVLRLMGRLDEVSWLLRIDVRRITSRLARVELMWNQRGSEPRFSSLWSSTEELHCQGVTVRSIHSFITSEDPRGIYQSWDEP